MSPKRHHHRPFDHWQHKHFRKYRQRFQFSRGRRFLLFFFFSTLFGLIPLLLIAGAILVTLDPNFAWPPDRHFFQPDRPFGPIILAGLIPLIGIILGRIARRRVADPLAGVLDAAEKVTEGNLSTRVDVHPGIFSELQLTFNRMIAELETTDQQRRNLTADVAHELNTPLHIIQGYLEGIADGIYQADETTINMLLDETNLLSRLVEDLRVLSLAEAGELPLKLEVISLEEFLTDVHTSFSGQSEEAGIQLTISAPSGLTVTADPDRLDQVIGNLVANALRHTPTGGQISIQAIEEDQTVKIIVEDTGEGIEPENLPHIFNRFWRKDKSRDRGDVKMGFGHGLGLAIAQQLVQAHGGTIEVESEVGVGTRFEITLPG